MQTHKSFTWIAGDDWRYFIRLTDENGDPYNINNISEIKWLLHNPAGLIYPHDYLISTLDATDGRISIWIPNDETTDFSAGVWADWVRINCDGIVSTLLTGPINVIADPWKAEVAIRSTIAPFVARSTENVVAIIDRRERIRREAISYNEERGTYDLYPLSKEPRSRFNRRA